MHIYQLLLTTLTLAFSGGNLLWLPNNCQHRALSLSLSLKGHSLDRDRNSWQQITLWYPFSPRDTLILWRELLGRMGVPIRGGHCVSYSGTCHVRPPYWPWKCGLSKQVFLWQVRLKCIWSSSRGVCGLSRQVISHSSGLSRQVSLYHNAKGTTLRTDIS